MITLKHILVATDFSAPSNAALTYGRALARTFQAKRGKDKTEVRAVAGVDIDVAEGEIVGFLGPNGAGKTTTLRMLTTLLKPTAGTATVAGYDLRREPVWVPLELLYDGRHLNSVRPRSEYTHDSGDRH